MTKEELDDYAASLRGAVKAHGARQSRGPYANAAAAAGTIDLLNRWIQMGYKKVRLNPARLGLSFNTLNMKLNQTINFIKDNADTMPAEIVDAAQRARISRMEREGVFYITDKGPIEVVANAGDALEAVDEEGAADARAALQTWLSEPREEGDKFETEVALGPDDIEWFRGVLDNLVDEFIFVIDTNLIKVIKHRAEV